MTNFNRRDFLRGALAAGATLASSKTLFAADGKSSATPGRILLGACQSSRDTVKKMKAIGYDFCEGGVSESLNPDKDGEWWKKRRDELLSLALPMRSVSGFIPGRFRLTGPNADHAPALDYAEKAIVRAKEAGIKYIVLGSGQARNVPGDYCSKKRPNIDKGYRQFTDFCRAVAKRMDGIDGVTIVIEPLRFGETNLIHYVYEGMHVVEDVDSPKIQLLADIFHMQMVREGADSIVRAGSMLKHCHIAENSSRSYPGDKASEVRRLEPYFAALKSIGYSGGVSCECNWGKGDIVKKLEKAFNTLKGMA